jgi:hypothetical protein
VGGARDVHHQMDGRAEGGSGLIIRLTTSSD